jgi:hypothetical protein
MLNSALTRFVRRNCWGGARSSVISQGARVATRAHRHRAWVAMIQQRLGACFGAAEHTRITSASGWVAASLTGSVADSVLNSFISSVFQMSGQY